MLFTVKNRRGRRCSFRKYAGLLMGCVLLVACLGLSGCSSAVPYQNAGQAAGDAGKSSDSDVSSSDGTVVSASAGGSGTSPATAGSEASPATAGSDASLTTPGSDASPAAADSEAAPSTAGSDASLTTPGSNASPATAGSDASPATAGSDASLTTPGSDASPAAAGSDAAPAVQLTYPLTLRVGYSTSESDPRGTALALMKEQVEKETDGRILLEIHPDGELGNDSELIAGLLSKDVDITVSSAANYALYATRIGVSAMPFLFEDFESAWEFIDSDTMQDLCSELEPYNMHVLAFFDNGFRCVTTTDHPVNKVRDMEGLNIRTPDNQIVMETMSELGANPKSYPFSMLKDALVSGRFDAQENPIPVIYNNGLYEVQKYLSITNHSYDAMPLTIRRDIWDRLSADDREILARAASEAQAMNRETVSKQTEEMVHLLEKEGMTVLYPDLGEFKEATEGVLHVFSDVFGSALLSKL